MDEGLQGNQWREEVFLEDIGHLKGKVMDFGSSFVIILCIFLEMADGYPRDGKGPDVHLDLKRQGRFVVDRLMRKDTKLDNGRPRY